MRSIIGLKCPCLRCQTWEKVLDFRLLNLIATVIDFCTPPTEQGRGHPRSATVRVLATLRQFLREGTPWRSLKATADKVSGSTLRRHLEQWAGIGVLAQVHAVLVGLLRGDPTLILDSGSVRAKRGGNLTGPNPTDRGKRAPRTPSRPRATAYPSPAQPRQRKSMPLWCSGGFSGPLLPSGRASSGVRRFALLARLLSSGPLPQFPRPCPAPPQEH